jgi:N-acetylneuraminic acid mutarotase
LFGVFFAQKIRKKIFISINLKKETRMCKILYCFFILAFACFVHADGWIPVTPTGDVPPAVVGHTLVEIQGEFYLFGGKSADSRSVLLNEIHKFTPSQNKWTKETPVNAPPDPREGHTAVVHNRKMYVFFGQGNAGDLKDVWAYNPAEKSWEKQTTPSTYLPQGRIQHGTVVLGNIVYVFGGREGSGNKIFGDLWAYNLLDKTWEVESYIPSGGAYGHAMSAAGNNLYIYGGQNTSSLNAETWHYQIAEKAWFYANPQNPPPARKNSISVQDLENMWVYGGLGVSGRNLVEQKDIWQYHFASNVWSKKTDGPIAQSQSAGILLPQKNGEDVSIFVFGGMTPTGPVTPETIWHYYSSPQPPDPPAPSEKEVLGQIGALGKGRFSLHYLSYEKDQKNLKIDIQWAQDKAKLKLFVLRLPIVLRGENPELLDMEENLENFHLKYLKHFEKIDIEPVEHKSRQTLSHTMNVKRGTLFVLLTHHYFTPTARDIQIKFTGMQDLPKKVQYIFPIGDPDKKKQPQNHFVQFPVVPTRWHSKYPSGSNGKETIETIGNLWKWNYLDQSTKFSFFPFACIKFDLP